MRNSASNREKGAPEISPAREIKIFEHLMGIYADHFLNADGTVKVKELQDFLRETAFFGDQPEKLEDVLRTLDGAASRTKMDIQSLLAVPLQQLRTETFPNYPIFERGMREILEYRNRFTPLTPDRTVAFHVHEEFVFLHIQPSYSLSASEKRRDFLLALRTLAAELGNPILRDIRMVGIDSWIVKEHPKMCEQLGFYLSEDRPGFACVSVSEFTKRWSGGNTEEQIAP